MAHHQSSVDDPRKDQTAPSDDKPSAIGQSSSSGEQSAASWPLPEPLDHEDAESALGSDDGFSDTTSLASTMLRNRELWGRSYHKFRSGENEYWGPNDEQQNDALDIGHHMITLALDGKLFLAPINPEQCHHVLDVGTGTGIWALDFADAYPNAEVSGVDLSPIQPSWVPPNCTFTVDDVEEDWTYPPNHFDFVHVRCLMGSIANWPALYKQAYQHLVPNGWIQHLDIDIRFRSNETPFEPDHVMAQFSEIFLDIGNRTGKTFDCSHHSARLLKDAGFVDVHEEWVQLPIGTWPKDKRMKEIGMYNYYYCSEGVEGWATYLLSNVMGWKLDEIQIFIAKMKAKFRDPNTHSWFYISVAYGRKPG